MRAFAFAFALASLGALASCKDPTPTPSPPPPVDSPAVTAPEPTGSAPNVAPPLASGTFNFSPRNEAISVGPIGTGDARCNLYVYAWKKGDKACKVQVNHCEVDPAGKGVRCMSLADERTVACGKTEDVCGQPAQCDCPAGEAEKVPDPPGAVHVTPKDVGKAIASDDKKCEAKVTKLPEEGPPPAPCILAIHDCTRTPCIDRTEMLSCTLRSEICGHPIKCDCP